MNYSEIPSPIDLDGSNVMSVALGIIAVLSLLLFIIVRREAALLSFSLACSLAASFALLPGETARGWPTSFDEFTSASALPLAVTGFTFALVASVQRMFAGQLGGHRFALALLLWLAGWEASIVYLHQGVIGRGIGLVAGVVGWFWFRRQAGRGWIFAGLVSSWLVTILAHRSFLQITFGPVLLLIVLVAVVTHLIALRQSLEASTQARLRSARLELELLKKHVQPHFLLNTLTALTEAIETTPKLAVSLIESLADEFRILVAVSAKATVPLGEELELCRAHLRVMSLRREGICTLVVDSESTGVMIPPGTLHTAIENGLTHQVTDDGRIEFRLSVESTPRETRLVLVAPGKPRRKRTDQMTGSGTGLKYIRARLEEAFPDRWQLHTCELPSGSYQTTYIIKARAE